MAQGQRGIEDTIEQIAELAATETARPQIRTLAYQLADNTERRTFQICLKLAADYETLTHMEFRERHGALTLAQAIKVRGIM